MEMMSYILAVVALTGLAIQQVLELLDPLVSYRIRKYIKKRDSTHAVLSEVELKKFWMVFLALILGVVTVAAFSEIRLLKYIPSIWEDGKVNDNIDFLVTALVLSAGTEGLNTIIKYFTYVKEGRKAAIAPAIEVEIVPSSTKVGQGETFQFRSIVKNASNIVKWEVSHGSGGSISNGLYKAPNQTGTYNVVAVCKSDVSKYATAMVTVT